MNLWSWATFVLGFLAGGTVATCYLTWKLYPSLRAYIKARQALGLDRHLDVD